MITTLDGMKRLARGEAPAPPVASLIGFTLVSAEAGRAVIELEATERHHNPMGTLHGGILCDIADAAMGTAYATTLDERETFTTLELKINFLRPVWAGTLTATGHVVHGGRSVGRRRKSKRCAPPLPYALISFKRSQLGVFTCKWKNITCSSKPEPDYRCSTPWNSSSHGSIAIVSVRSSSNTWSRHPDRSNCSSRSGRVKKRAFSNVLSARPTQSCQPRDTIASFTGCGSRTPDKSPAPPRTFYWFSRW